MRLATLDPPMTDRNNALKPREDAGRASAEDGVVILDGPDGVAVTMTADAAARTADSLHEAARQARSNLSAQAAVREDADDDRPPH